MLFWADCFTKLYEAHDFLFALLGTDEWGYRWLFPDTLFNRVIYFNIVYNKNAENADSWLLTKTDLQQLNVLHAYYQSSSVVKAG